MWGGLGFLFLPFFCLARASSIYFYSEVLKTDRPAWRGGAGPPSSLAYQPLLTLREAQATLLTPSHCPSLAVSLLSLCPQPGSPFLHSLGLDDLRSQKTTSVHICFPKVSRDREPRPEAEMRLQRPQARAQHAPGCSVGLAYPGVWQRVQLLGWCWRSVPGP